MSPIAIIAGSGTLPHLLAERIASLGTPPLFAVMAGQEVPVPECAQALPFEIERIGSLFATLKEAGVREVVFAGGIARPALDPSKFDATLLAFAPRFLPALSGGDDALLRVIIALFEENDLKVRAPNEIAPELCLSAGEGAGREMTDAETADAARGREILAHLSALDLGQGCVVASGLCLGIETLQGTDALLRFVGETPAHLRRAPGVFIKAPKAGQDMRIDMPTIGPETIKRVAEAGLAGLVIPAGGVIVLDRRKVFSVVEAAGLFLRAI